MELSKEQKATIQQAVSFMQSASLLLQDVDDRQKNRGSESERLFGLSLELMNHYQMMPGQENYKGSK